MAQYKQLNTRHQRVVIGVLMGLVLMMLPVIAVSPQKPNAMLLPYTPEALENRQPIILVHGIGGDDDGDYYHWDDLLTHTRQDPAFTARYKIYLFHYNPAQSVQQSSTLLQQSLKRFLRQHPTPIRLVGYSQGGLLIRNALQDAEVFNSTNSVITIATPFHGTPMASVDQLEPVIQAKHRLSPIRLGHRVAYWIAKTRYPHFENDFRWDDLNPRDYRLSTHPRFISYGGYFDHDTVDPQQQLAKTLHLTNIMPEEKTPLSFYIKRNLFFSVGNDTLAAIPETTETHREADPSIAALALSESDPDTKTNQATALPSLTRFSDGLIPVNSSLWLGRFLHRHNHLPNPNQQQWAALQGLQHSQRARLFVGLDHRNWMENETRTETLAVRDLLNPTETPKTVFEWIVTDLMRN